MKKRILSMLLAIAMLLGMLPAAALTASAADNAYMQSDTLTKINVTLDANNGTGETKDIPVGETATLTDDAFTYLDCEIESWNTEKDGSGTSYEADEVISVTDSMTLYAQWVLPLNKYASTNLTNDVYEWTADDADGYAFDIGADQTLYARVNFPSNDKAITVTADQNSKIAGSISFVSSATSLDGYANQKAKLTIKGATAEASLEFAGLNGTANGDTLTVETDVTITGPNDLFIGASGGMDSKIVISDASLTLGGGLTLLGYLEMNGQAQFNIAGCASFHNHPTITLSNAATIYIGGDGYGGTLRKEYVSGGEAGQNDAFDDLYSNNWLPDGYTFQDGDWGYQLYDEYGQVKTGPLTIQKRFTVTITDDGNGTAAATVSRALKGEEVTLSAEPVEGYRFKQWLVLSGGVTVEDDTFTVGTEDVQIKALFEEAYYLVTVENGSGSGEFKENDTVTIIADTPAEGRKFTGWTSDDGVTFADSTERVTTFTMPAKAVTVTANYAAKAFTITFDTDGGSDVAPITQDYGADVAAPADPTKDGYVFAGWAKEDGSDFTFDGYKMGAEDLTLYAKWDEVGIPTYNVKVPDNTPNGVIVSSKTTAYKDDIITLTVTPDDGYKPGVLAVTDSEGSTIELTKVSDTEYTFKMPASDVDVYGNFVVASYECPKDHTCPIYPFPDAQTTAWYHDGVHYCIENGLMIGFDDGTFRPDDTTTRAMIIMTLWRLEGSPEVNGAMSFEDVASGAWFAEAIRWAASNGIVEGYSSAAFGPNDTITREQMATIMWRYCKYKGIDVSVGETTNIQSYGDVDSVSDWAAAAMQWACGSGMIQGIADGSILNLAPQSGATRAQAATILYHFCEAIVKEG